MVSAIPKAHEIAGDLHRPSCRRQQFEQQGQPARGDARRLVQSEHFLQTHRQRGDLAVQVVDRHGRAAGHDEMRGRFAFQDHLLRVGQTGSQGISQVHPGKMLAACQAGNPGRRPVLESRGERRIAQIRPWLRPGDGVLPHQADARLPLPQLRGPRQAGRPQLPKARERRVLHGLAVGIANLGRIQQQGAQAALAPRANRLLAIVPNYLGVIADLRRKILFEVCVPQGSREKNPRLAFRAVQFRRDDELGFGERLRFPKACASAVRQKVPSAVAACAADAVGISPRQQDSGPVMRVRRVMGRADIVALPLPGTAHRLRHGAVVHGDPGR